MSKWIDPIALLVVFVIVVVFVGCPATKEREAPFNGQVNRKEQGSDNRSPANRQVIEDENAVTTRIRSPQNEMSAGDKGSDQVPEEVALAEIPSVVLSEQHAAASLFQMGGSLTEFSAQDAIGDLRRIGDHLGDAATAVVFWNADEPTSLEQLADVNTLLLEPYGDLGIRVILINPLQSPDDVEQVLAELHPSVTALFTSALEVKTDETEEPQLPQTFLLDEEGTVVWYDVEYSRSTRRDLNEAIRHLLKLPGN